MGFNQKGIFSPIIQKKMLKPTHQWQQVLLSWLHAAVTKHFYQLPVQQIVKEIQHTL